MRYFSKEIQRDGYIYKTAGVKARDDVDAILRECGYKELFIPTVGDDRKKAGKAKKLMAHFTIRNSWSKETKKLKAGDSLFIQYPTVEHSIFLTSVLRDLRKKGVKLYFLIHDLLNKKISRYIYSQTRKHFRKNQLHNLLYVLFYFFLIMICFLLRYNLICIKN